MVEVKTLAGALNLDDNQYRLPPNDYIDALNISHDAVEGSNDEVITNIIGNRLVPYTYHSGGIPTTIGTYANTLRSTIIEFAFHPTGYHTIIEFDIVTRVRSKIFENLTDSGDVDVLGFTLNGKITGINIYNRDEGDLLFFLDSLGRPTFMNIVRFKSGEYTPVTRVIIDVAKKPSLSPPSVIYDNDTTVHSNNLINKLFKFFYRLIYDDFFKSSWSPISIVPLPVSVLSDIYTSIITNNNVIRMVLNTGDKNCKSIEIGMSYVNKTNTWSPFQSVATLDKSSLGLVSSTHITTGSLDNDAAVTTYSGGVTVGAIINVYLTELPNTETLVGTYTVVDGDTIPDITAGLVTSMQGIGIAQSATANGNVEFFVFDRTIYNFDRVDIILDNPDALDNIDFPFAFYNDSTYPTLPLEEVIELYDYVPLLAYNQDMPNGNILVYGGITEGYNKDTIENATITILTIPATEGGGGSLYAVPTPGFENGTQQGYYYAFVGIPSTGTIVEVKVKRTSDNAIITASTYTTIASDTAISVAIAVKNALTAPAVHMVDNGLGTLLVEVFKSTYEPISGSLYSQLVITPPVTAENSTPSWKWSSQRSIARAYFDVHGVTNGILYYDKITFPPYAENGSQQPLLPYINYQINDIPPIWAYSFQFYMNKINPYYIFWETMGVDKSETEYIYFDVTSFIVNAEKKPTTSTVLSYSFEDGDRMRVIRNTDSPGIVYDDTYDAAVVGLVVDPVINFIPQMDKQFLKIRNVEPFTTGIAVFKNYVIEIYRPNQQSANDTNQAYFEFGQEFDILDPGLDTRRHSGQVTDQVVGVTPAEFNFYNGDAYYRSRTIAVGGVGYQTFAVMDVNFVDFYISAVSSLDGRPNQIDLNARQAYYSTLVRFGQAYQADTNINGLNRFYGKNSDEYDYSYGPINRLKVRDRTMKVFQKYKVGIVPLYSSIGKASNGTEVVFQTDKLLNPIQYRSGNFGLSMATGFASFEYADYGADTSRGVLWRDSKDGLIPISLLYKMNSWANDNLPLRTGDHFIYMAFDQRLNNLITHLDAVVCETVNVPDYTLNNAPVNTFFTQSVELIGSLEFTLLPLVIPNWMTVSISGRTLTYSGTPTVIETGLTVYINIVNDCGDIFVLKTITVVA